MSSNNSSNSSSASQQQQSVNINSQQQSQQPQQQQPATVASQQQNPYFHGSPHQQQHHHHLLGSQQQQQQQQYHQTLHNAINNPHHHIQHHQLQHNQQQMLQSGGATSGSGLVTAATSTNTTNILGTQQQQQQQIKSTSNNMSSNPVHSVNPLPNSSQQHSPQQQQQSTSAIAPQQQQQQSSANPLQELLSLFECPVCFEFALPPIMQCQSGHIVCSNCRPKLSCCPTCRSALGNIRNLSMEKIAYSIKFPCKYTSYGCTECMSHETKLEHEDVCEFRMYNCPCPGASCKWQGTLEQVMPHLLQQHKSITTLQGEDIVFLATDITLPGAVDWVMMQSCFGYNFMLVLEKQEKHENYPQFFAVVQLIGTRRQAERFVYKLELNGQRRRLTWEATPRSIHDGVQQAITSSDCLVFDTHTAQLFADSGNLGINVTISLN